MEQGRRYVLVAWLGAAIRPAFSSFVAIAGAIAVGTSILIGTGVDPGFAYFIILSESLGTEFGVTKILIELVPLLITALGLLICFRAGIWNLGAQGQMLIGALLANVVGYSFGPLPSPVIIPLLLLAGMVAGAAWALPPALLKAKLGINEVITTMLLNFVAMNILRFLIKGILRDVREEHPLTYPIVSTAKLPNIYGTQVHIGILIALAFGAVVYLLMARTKLGFELRILGQSLKTARYIGLPVGRLIVLAFVISGAASGLAGAIQVSGVMRNINPVWTPGYWLAAVPLVFIAKMSPIAVIPLSLLFAVLLVGGDIMHRTTGVPVYFVDILLSLMLLFFAVSEVVWRIQMRRVEG